MPIISPVESKSPKGRLLHLAIIIALSIGAVTMIYPFVVMLSGSVRSEMDGAELNLVPAFWHDDAVLYAKFLETKYNQDITSLTRVHGRAYFEFAAVEPPADPDPRAAARLEAWVREADLPTHWQALGGVYGVKTVPENLRRLRERLYARYDGDLAALGKDLGVPLANWGVIVLSPPQWLSRRFDYRPDMLHEEYFELMRDRPVAERQLVSITGAFLETMIYPVDGQRSTAKYNLRHPRAPLARYDDFRLPRTVPGADRPVLRREWIEFVRQELNPSFIVVGGGQADAFREMLAEVYNGDIAALSKAWGASFAGFEQVPLPQGEWLSGQRRLDYQAFLATRAPADLVLVGPEYAWADHLRALGRSWDGPAARPMPPMPQLEWHYVLGHTAELRWAFTTRNYIIVWNELVTQGNALVNTVIFVALSIGLSMLINPLAAYAMSRYRLPGTYKLLLLLMATMAFPPMVAMIPQFIVLEKLGLFNTFIALVLPLMVNGYMIFLLKGFFDSLPQELYEAARIDGAGEIRMFFGITMALSKPILAVLALTTFTASYMMFLYPLLVAPDPDMWLISVWLYQFQQRASTPGVFASVVVASIPTLVVFMLVQRTIMRGIVVPTEK